MTNDNLEEKTQEELEEEQGVETEGEEEEETSVEDEEEEIEEETEEEDDESLAKFKGKTPEDLIKMYKNLEGRIDREAIRKAQELLAKSGGKKPEGDGKKENDLADEIEKMDFSKMDPKEFARWILTQVDARSVKKAQEIYEQNTKVKSTVQREIKEASKAHPHLKENPEYRDVVISLIEASAVKGETLTLKEACEKADKAMGIKPGEKKVEKLVEKKKVKTGVEKPTGTDSDKNDDEESLLKKGLLGGKSSSPLGGLGI